MANYQQTILLAIQGPHLSHGSTPATHLISGTGLHILKKKTNYLKVPKREIFDRSDFPDFYTMKSLRVGDFGVKIKNYSKISRGSFRGAKFLTRMLSVFLRRFFF
jgi:hypothetical protein